jgi:putative oxidoreductase
MTAPTPTPGFSARRLPVLLLRLGLGGLFVVAGAFKLRDPAGFAVEIANYQLLPALAPYLAAALPTTEVVLGLGLILLPSSWRRAAAVGVGLLFGMFTLAVGSAYLRGINIACGCFGGGGDAIGPLTLVRNLGLLIAVAVVLLGDRPAPTPGAAQPS